ncbi:MAG: hypothetical protein KDH94_08295, partial [Coxiellaceae bacterium]|nr:hypothetical protein [Coxiellaceae bacterium]
MDERKAHNQLWYQQTPESLLIAFDVDSELGLPDHEVDRRRQQYGDNAIEQPRGRSFILIFAQQFQSLLILILM